MQERELPQWFILEWNAHQILVAGIRRDLDHHLDNHHGTHTWRDWGIKGGTGLGFSGLVWMAWQVIQFFR